MDRNDLARCQDELRATKEENEHLREAASSFGALAERLKDQLAVERRHNGDRRRERRDTTDRRKGQPEVGGESNH